VYDYNSISFEARERVRSREQDGVRERIARSIRVRTRREWRVIVRRRAPQPRQA
jgi:hypothetical protein